MESFIKDYVDASLDLTKAETRLIEELHNRLNVDEGNFKSISLETVVRDTQFVQVIVIQLTGANSFRSEDLVGINGLTIITPNRIEISAGEIDL